MKTHRLVLGSIAIALATAMAATAAAQDPEQGPKQKPAAPATKKAPAAKAPAKTKPAAKEQAPDVEEAEAAPAEDEAAAEAGEASDEAAEAETEGASEAEPAEAETTTPSTTPTETTAPTTATSPDKPRAAAVPPMYYGPAELEFVEGGTIPPGYIKDTRIRKGLVIGGAVTWGVGWLAAATAAAGIIKEEDQYDDMEECTYSNSGYYCSDRDDDDVSGAAALFVPLVGPFIAMYTMRHEVDGAANAALFLDGMIQVTGFSLLVAGVAAKKTVLVRDPGASVALRPGPGGATLTGSF